MKARVQRLRSLFPEWGTGSIRELPPHRNAGLEIVCISKGRLRWRIENRVYEVGPGFVFYTFPWELHGSVEEFEPGHRWDFVVLTIFKGKSSRKWNFPPAFGLAQAEGSHLLDRLIRSPHRSLAAGARLKWLMPALQSELATPRGADPAMATTLAKAVLLELDRMIAQASSIRSPELEQNPDRCENLLRRLQSAYAEPWSLKAMSRVAGLGRTRLSHLIKERTGDSPIVHLNRVRIGKAQKLLRQTDRSVTDIAFDCGFQSSQYFARTFKQRTGLTPGGYRAVCQRASSDS